MPSNMLHQMAGKTALGILIVAAITVATAVPVQACGVMATDDEMREWASTILTSDDEEARRRATMMLAMICCPPPAEVRPALEKAIDDPSPRIRYWAVSALIHNYSADAAVVPVLLGAKADADVEVRAAVASGLANVSPSDDGFATLVHMIRHDESDRVRQAATWAIAHHDGRAEAIRDILIATLVNDTADEVRASAAYQLGNERFVSRGIVKLLTQTLKDDSHDVRSGAIGGLRNLEHHSRAALPALIECLRNLDDADPETPSLRWSLNSAIEAIQAACAAVDARSSAAATE